LLDSLEDAEADSAVRATAARHESELSRSVALARRFDLIATRLAESLPWVALVVGALLAGIAALAARQLSRQLSRPVGDMVDWASRLAHEQPLPEPGLGEGGDPEEFTVLRQAFRSMAGQLAEGRRQAVEAERLKALTEMARRVAHELKNPLTPLMLAARQAQSAAAGGRVESLGEPLDVITHEAERLDEMARSFAQLGRLPEGPPSEIDVEEMLRRLMESDLPPTVSGELHVAEPLPLVKGHLEALNRAFRNLLGNAVEALRDRSDGRVEVTLSRAEGAIEIAIADNGPGVASQHRDRVWDPDFTTKTRGTGLGLALVRQTVRAHGGEVTLSSSETGACFVVRLPAIRGAGG
jgi:signal transduction histidine kinase